MGGVTDFISSSGFQAGMGGLATGVKAGTGIANALYNAAGAESAAKAAEEQSRLNAYMIRKQYEADYKTLRSGQERQSAENQVLALKRGITGGSADNAMQSYAAKDQRNRERLFYNAAMQTGAQSVQASMQAGKMREMARQYRWQATSEAIAGVINTGTAMINVAAKNMGSKADPVPDPVKGMDSGLGYALESDLWGQDFWSSMSMPSIGAR